MNSFPNKIKWPALAAVLFACVTLADAGVKVGDALPDLAGAKLEGKLPDTLQGKVVLVDFWASWCLPCAQSFPVMEDLQEKYKDRGLVVLAVNVDETNELMQNFLKKHAVTFPVVRDADQKLVAAFAPETMPTSFLVDTDGKVRYLHNGFHGETTRKEYITEIESLLKGTP